jgi:MFS transporter, MHS family, proline/betaine transporter
MILPVKSKRRISSILIGNVLEHYDTALFAFLAPFFAPLFFPFFNELTNLVIAFAMIPLGKISKPLGAFIIGHLGDRYGRLLALRISLRGMAVFSLAIVFLPTYDSIGWLAPIGLLLCRIAISFFAAGECMGGGVYLLESTEKIPKGVLSSIFASSTVAGILLASTGVSLLSLTNSMDIGWRLLYLIGSLTAVVGSFFRKGYEQKEDWKGDDLSWKKRLKICWSHRKPLLTLVFASGFSYATYSLVFVMMNGFIPLVSSFSYQEMMGVNTTLLFLDFALLPIIAILFKKASYKSLMIVGVLFLSAISLPLFYCLKTDSFTSIFLVRFVLMVAGVLFAATFHAWAQELVPEKCRFTGVSIAYVIGAQLLGAPSAAVGVFLYQLTGNITSPSWYLILLGFLTVVLLARNKEYPSVKLTK